MQADVEVKDKRVAEALWNSIRTTVRDLTKTFVEETNVHKQTVGRVIEPFCYVKCVMTGTNWDNFFALRAEYNAEPHLGYLATLMLDLYLNQKPIHLDYKDWHIPFLTEEDLNDSIDNKLIKSVTRCARTSYDNFYGTKDLEKDKKLFNMLKEHGHWSPFEHQAQAGRHPSDPNNQRSNFNSVWCQYRKLVEKNAPIDLQERLVSMKELCKKRGFSF